MTRLRACWVVPPQIAWKSADQGGEHGPVWPRQARAADLAAEHGDLVAEYQQLGGQRGLAACDLRQPAEHSNGGQVQQSYNHATDRARRPQNASSTMCALSRSKGGGWRGWTPTPAAGSTSPRPSAGPRPRNTTWSSVSLPGIDIADFPRRHVEAEYRGVLRFDDEIEVRLRAERVGRTSITYSWRILRGGELCIVGRHTVVHVDGAGRAAPVPDGLRAALRGAPVSLDGR
jgi:hypothetical protein